MVTKRNSALIAGIVILMMAAVAAFTYGYIHNTLIIPGNPENTVGNIKSSGLLFKAEILGWSLILICDVIAAWALYIFFRNDHPKLSLLMAGLRIIYTAILGVAILNFIQILNILGGNTIANSEFGTQKVILHLQSFEMTWSFGLIIFGFHLLLLGFLALKSWNIHRFWGIMLIVAAVSYVGIHCAKILLPEFENPVKTAEMILSLPMTFGEVGFAVWLIIRGGKANIHLHENLPNR